MTALEKPVFVTGATGFLGSALTRHLASHGASVRALARQPGVRVDLEGVEVVQGDVTDGNRMRALIRGCGIVFHAAATMGGSPIEQHQVNVDGTRNVMRAATEAGIERVVHVSSFGAYGFSGRSDFSEATPLEPGHAAYGVSKAESEDVVREIARETGVSYSIIRPGMIYGPGSGVWTEAMYKLARRRPTLFPGDGSGSMPAVHVSDVIGLMSVLAVHPAASEETFNCTSDPSPTWREFLGAYSRLAGHDRWFAIPLAPLRVVARLVAAFAPSGTRFKDLPQLIEFVTSQHRFPMDKARELLDWQPQVGLTEGIESYVPFLREKGLLDT